MSQGSFDLDDSSDDSEVMLTMEMTSVVIMVVVTGLDKFVNVFRYHCLDTETSFPGCLICMQPLFPATLLRKFLPGNFFIKVKRSFELSAIICTYPWLDIHCLHVWYFLVFCTCDPKERKIE